MKVIYKNALVSDILIKRVAEYITKEFKEGAQLHDEIFLMRSLYRRFDITSKSSDVTKPLEGYKFEDVLIQFTSDRTWYTDFSRLEHILKEEKWELREFTDALAFVLYLNCFGFEITKEGKMLQQGSEVVSTLQPGLNFLPQEGVKKFCDKFSFKDYYQIDEMGADFSSRLDYLINKSNTNKMEEILRNSCKSAPMLGSYSNKKYHERSSALHSNINKIVSNIINSINELKLVDDIPVEVKTMVFDISTIVSLLNNSVKIEDKQITFIKDQQDIITKYDLDKFINIFDKNDIDQSLSLEISNNADFNQIGKFKLADYVKGATPFNEQLVKHNSKIYIDLSPIKLPTQNWNDVIIEQLRDASNLINQLEIVDDRVDQIITHKFHAMTKKINGNEFNVPDRYRIFSSSIEFNVSGPIHASELSISNKIYKVRKQSIELFKYEEISNSEIINNKLMNSITEAIEFNVEQISHKNLNARIAGKLVKDHSIGFFFSLGGNLVAYKLKERTDNSTWDGYHNHEQAGSDNEELSFRWTRDFNKLKVNSIDVQDSKIVFKNDNISLMLLGASDLDKSFKIDKYDRRLGQALTSKFAGALALSSRINSYSDYDKKQAIELSQLLCQKDNLVEQKQNLEKELSETEELIKSAYMGQYTLIKFDSKISSIIITRPTGQLDYIRGPEFTQWKDQVELIHQISKDISSINYLVKIKTLANKNITEINSIIKKDDQFSIEEITTGELHRSHRYKIVKIEGVLYNDYFSDIINTLFEEKINIISEVADLNKYQRARLGLDDEVAKEINEKRIQDVLNTINNNAEYKFRTGFVKDIIDAHASIIGDDLIPDLHSLIDMSYNIVNADMDFSRDFVLPLLTMEQISEFSNTAQPYLFSCLAYFPAKLMDSNIELSSIISSCSPELLNIIDTINDYELIGNDLVLKNDDSTVRINLEMINKELNSRDKIMIYSHAYQYMSSSIGDLISNYIKQTLKYKKEVDLQLANYDEDLLYKEAIRYVKKGVLV